MRMFFEIKIFYENNLLKCRIMRDENHITRKKCTYEHIKIKNNLETDEIRLEQYLIVNRSRLDINFFPDCLKAT